MPAIELHLLRDWQPRSRPSKGEFRIGEGGTPDIVKLFPGAAAVGNEMMLVYLEGVTRSGHSWVTARIGVTIDGTFLGEPRPATWWLGYSDGPSGIVHYPVVAGADNLMFKGHHSLLVRTVL